MENKKVEEPKKKAQADAAYTPKGAGQNRDIGDEATKVLRELEQKGRQIINEAVKVAQADAAKIVAQAKQEAQQIVEKAREQVRSDGGGRNHTEEQISHTVREANNAVIELQSGNTMSQTLDTGFSIIVEATKKAERELEQKGRQIINEAVKVAQADAAKIVAQAKQEAQQIVEKAKEQVKSDGGRGISTKEEQMSQTVRESNNAVIELQSTNTMNRALDAGFSIIVEATRKAEMEGNNIVAQAKETGRRIIEEAARKREPEAEKIVSQAKETGRQIIEEATRKAADEANKIVTQALQTGLQIVVEAARIAETGVETTKRISSGETKQLRFVEEAEGATANRMSRGGNYSDIEHVVQQFTEQTDENALSKDLVRKAFANSELKARTVAEEANIATTRPPLQKLKSIVQSPKEDNVPETKVKAGKQTAVYQGQIELVIVPPIDFIQLERLRRALQRLKNINVLSTEGSTDGRTAISVLLNRQCPLIADLTNIEEVEEALAEETIASHPLGEVFKKTLPPRTSKRTKEQRVLVVLKKTR